MLNLDVNMSSRAKGESIMDTIFTLQAMQVDIFVVRDASTGVPARIAQQVAPHVCVLNAGESDVSHPTQGLLDLLTIQRHKGDVRELCVAIVGDIKHSRVARSAHQALTKFGVGELRLVGPAELLPEDDAFAGAVRVTEIADGIRGADVVMALRVQRERFAQLDDIPDPQEYFRRYGLTEERLELARRDAIVMHPGPDEPRRRDRQRRGRRPAVRDPGASDERPRDPHGRARADPPPHSRHAGSRRMSPTA